MTLTGHLVDGVNYPRPRIDHETTAGPPGSCQKAKSADADLRELKSTSACLACEGTMLHLYYTALFGVIGANAITILVAIAIAISRRKHDSEH